MAFPVTFGVASWFFPVGVFGVPGPIGREDTEPPSL
jgi:hypothetical protein